MLQQNVHSALQASHLYYPERRVYADGSRYNPSSPELGCGRAVVAVTKEGEVEAATFGPWPGRVQTVPRATHWAVEKVTHVAQETITVMDDCQGVVDGAKLARAAAESSKYAGA